MQYSVSVCSLPEVDSRVISGRCIWLTIPHKCVQFRDPRFNSSEQIRPKVVVVGGIFGLYSNLDKCRPEVTDDVISGAALAYVGVDVPAKFGDSRLYIGRII